MEERGWERKLRDAVSNAAPDDFEGLLSACEDVKGETITMTEHRHTRKRWVPWVAAAAVLALVLAGGAAGYALGSRDNVAAPAGEPSGAVQEQPGASGGAPVAPPDPGTDGASEGNGTSSGAALPGTATDTPYTPGSGQTAEPDDPAWSGQQPEAPVPLLATVLFDVNPSVAVTADTEEIVRSVEPLNSDGEKVLGGMELAGTNLETCTNALIGAFLRHGYITQLENAILVTVERQGTANVGELETRVASWVSDTLRGNGVDGAVLSQTIASGGDARGGVSAGKTALIDEIVAMDGRLTFEELAKLTVAELMRLSEGRNITVPHVAQNGTVNDGGYITGKDAFVSACQDRGIDYLTVEDYEAELDCENGVMIYEVEFCLDGVEYECEVDAATGKVLRCETEPCDHEEHRKPAPDADIGREAAGEAACRAAGVAAADALDLTVEADFENGVMIYEVEFCCKGVEYECEVDAATGKVLRCETEPCDHEEHRKPASDADIGREAAGEAACRAAGVAAADALDLTAELDCENGVMIYEVEFCCKGVEYECEVDAATGKVLRCETEPCDHEEHGSGHHGDASAGAGAVITADAALEIAVVHAGVLKSETRGVECELDDGVYEIEFRAGNMEYEYEIDAVTGKILKHEKEPVD